MDSLTLGFFITFTVVAGLLLIWTVRGICRRTSARFGIIRFWCWIPFVIYGIGVAMNTGGGYFTRIHPAYIFLGIWLPVWCIISSFISRRCRKRSSMKDWATAQRSRGPFYILCVDAALLVSLIVDASRFPINTTPYWLFEGDLGKVMRFIMITLIASQGVLLIPMTRLPRLLEAIVLVISRRHASLSTNLSSSHDLERLLPEESQYPRNAALTRILRKDAIALRLSRKLHYSDLVNLSLTSKSIRGAVFYPLPNTSSSRIESLCEASCIKGKKSQCWACERVICRECRVSRRRVYASRAVDHVKHCYAICTKCYLLRAPARAAPFEAKWHSHDLGKQHFGCSLSEPKRVQGRVYLCPMCSSLDEAAVSALREERDSAFTRRAVCRTIDCAMCGGALKERSRRWWICEKGEHECHWAGHETMNSKT